MFSKRASSVYDCHELNYVHVSCLAISYTGKIALHKRKQTGENGFSLIVLKYTNAIFCLDVRIISVNRHN